MDALGNAAVAAKLRLAMNPPQFPPRPTALAQDFLRPLFTDGDIAIDATAGNGHDTAFLAECVGASGRVLAFDVQAAAVAATRDRLTAAGLAERVEIFHESHAAMADRTGGKAVAAVMFNLGYLPGGNRELTTATAETLAGLEAAARVLKPGGVLTVVCYPGHPGGDAEAVAVEDWLSARAADGWRVARYGAIATRRPAPFLLVGAK